jgi:diadenosine tetraphosphatase ApaH/serine/threonine PP2A family protein phosphatase
MAQYKRQLAVSSSFHQRQQQQQGAIANCHARRFHNAHYPWPVPAALLAAAVATSLAFAMDQTRTNYNTVTTTTTAVHCEATATPQQQKGTTNFQVLAALESQDELEKVRMAQILFDLHALAKESAKLAPLPAANPRIGPLRRAMTFIGFSKPPLAAVLQIPATVAKKNPVVETANGAVDMNLCETDMMKLSPLVAQELIQALQHGGRFDTKSLLRLLEASVERLKQDPTLVDLRGKVSQVAVVGDLHGSLTSLANVLKLVKDDMEEPDAAVVFNGDFVDRGSDSMEVICTLLLLKLAYPERVYLLRGNHEDNMVAAAYGFQDEVRLKYSSKTLDDGLWESLSNVFSALPICVRTEAAAILHGGLPNDHFSLSDVEKITVEERCQIKTAVEPRNEVERLLEGILWSDPSSEEGIRPNSRRGCGILFGPAIARDFLERHNLKYLIRAHEVAEAGTKILDVGGGRSVMTVFSSAAYPDGKGENLGAVIHLDSGGGCRSSEFSQKQCSKKPESKTHPYQAAIHSLIASNQVTLAAVFESFAPEEKGGMISTEDWAYVMDVTLEVPDIPWITLQPFLAPTTERDGDWIDWKEFLEEHSVAVSIADVQGALDHAKMEILYANHAMLMTVFKFLDADGSGYVNRNEFRIVIDLVNKRRSKDRQLQDPDVLFRALDTDNNGLINLEEFSRVFQVL